MDRTKPLKDNAAEPGAGEEAPPPASELSSFLARGLRESQRPPPPGRESQRPSGVVRTSQPPASTPPESDGPAALSGAAAAIEPQTAAKEGQSDGEFADEGAGVADVGAASTALAQAPIIDTLPDEPVADESSSLDGDAVGDPEDVARTDSDYVVPVPLFARPRIIAGVVAAVVLTLVLAFWLSRETKAPARVDIPHATPVAAHEPLPPAPPPVADPEEQISDTEEEATLETRRGAGGPVAPEPSVTPPFGPNVARYPDLPTPVLIELEKALEEKAATKPK